MISAIVCAVLLIGVPMVMAQDTTTATGPTNSVVINYIACGDAGVINVSGTMLTGWDIYYQLYDNAGGTGNALSSLRQLAVDGNYAVSERLTYANAVTIATGATGSARVLIARETNSSSIDFETTVNDLQDGCNAPQNAAATSIDTGTGAPAGTSATTSTAVRILAPGGGVLNPSLEPESEVFLGARPSLNFRSETPGVIFAECDNFELANPGLVYDTDNVVVFWSWFTRTRAQMDQHLATAQYSVRLNGAILDEVAQSAIGRRGGANQWVFFTGQVGNLRPGHYEVEYKLSWSEPHFDGYDNYGPGTENPNLTALCNFDVLPNPTGIRVTNYTLKYFPTPYAVHDLFPGQ
jgi:hypothetical protein